jgi:CRISPR-associated protein Cas1
MIKRTLYFGNPAYLKTKDEQLVIEVQQLPLSNEEKQGVKSVPIEDIGILILDHQQITITQAVMAKLLANNTAIIICDNTHHPVGMQLSLDGHTLQSQKFKAQIEASAPLKKQLWQQTISSKISNQANLLKQEKVEMKYMQNLSLTVKSGDSDNCEARAAVYYWKNIFPEFLQFRRERYGPPPNN